MRFVHTADWQIGKPFARISDPRKRALVNQARVAVVGRIGRVVEEQGAEFVLVAGDLFDSPSVDKATVSAACGAIGRIPVPVIAIPGNHDHAGPGSIWEQEFFMREREQLAPNLVVLTEPGVYRIKSAFILACPLRARTGWADPTEWVRTPETWVPSEGTGGSRGEAEGEAGGFGSRDGVEGPRIVLAHGSTQVFVGRCDDEDELERTSGSGFIDLSRLPDHLLDYIALGDWHGTKQVGPKAWYAGTPEPDRFAKSGEYDPGNILVVDVEPGGEPRVNSVHVGELRWAQLSLDVSGATGVQTAVARIEKAVGFGVDEALLRLELSGSVDIAAAGELERVLQSQEARLLRLKLVDRTTVEPGEDELVSLLSSADHPLVAKVTERLLAQAEGEGDAAAIARIGLRDLHAAVESQPGARVAAAKSGGRIRQASYRLEDRPT